MGLNDMFTMPPGKPARRWAVLWVSGRGLDAEKRIVAVAKLGVISIPCGLP